MAPRGLEADVSPVLDARNVPGRVLTRIPITPNGEAMKTERLNPGDVVYAATEIRNDGSIPEIPASSSTSVVWNRRRSERSCWCGSRTRT